MRLSELDAPNITLGSSFIVMSVGDARGYRCGESAEVNGTALTIQPGTGLEQGGRACISLTQGTAQAEPEPNMALNLSGTGDFSVVPAGVIAK
ncbi:inner membrane CreD family protein [Escherichia coli]